MGKREKTVVVSGQFELYIHTENCSKKQSKCKQHTDVSFQCPAPWVTCVESTTTPRSQVKNQSFLWRSTLSH